jgi:ATP-dependent DNA helicase 2 subunit 2
LICDANALNGTEQNNNIKHVVKLSDSENVDIIDLKDALDQLSTFKVKNVNPTPVFRGDIILGDKEAHPDEALSIPVFMYARTYESKLPTAKKWSALSEMQENKIQWPTHDVGKEVSFRVKGSKSSADEGQASVTQADNEDANETGETSAPLLSDQDLERAYPFGKSLVVVTQEDERFMKMSTRAGMFIIGFLSATKVSWWSKCLTILFSNFSNV